MKEFKGTKAPWHLSIPTHIGKWAGFNTNQGKCYGIYSVNDDLEAIAIVPKDTMLAHSVQDNLANAQLIASAPELLEALQNTLSTLKSMIGTTHGDWIQVQEAERIVNKALGE